MQLQVLSNYSYLVIIYLHTVIWYQIFLSNANNMHAVIWFQVFLYNTNDL